MVSYTTRNPRTECLSGYAVFARTCCRQPSPSIDLAELSIFLPRDHPPDTLEIFLFLSCLSYPAGIDGGGFQTYEELESREEGAMAHDWERYSDDGPERSAGSWTEAIFATLVLVVLLASAIIALSLV